MANPEHFQILCQGVEVWNAWRAQHKDITPDLGNASPPEADLTNFNMARINLARGHLARAILACVNLSRADLTHANLVYASLPAADLTHANLAGANLRHTNLVNVDLTGADISEATLGETVFSDTNLTAVRGLETCYYKGPSTLDHRTLAKSGPLPFAFLRGCGLPDTLIDYLPSLLNEPFQFYSCFISYASKDHAFAERLHADLQNKGVRCWFAPEDLKIGDRLRPRIDETIRVHDKLLLVLSKTSVG